MSIWLIILVAVIYAVVAVQSLLKAEYGSAVLFASYATANLGLILITKGV
jgi:hypothetical protein